MTEHPNMLPPEEVGKLTLKRRALEAAKDAAVAAACGRHKHGITEEEYPCEDCALLERHDACQAYLAVMREQVIRDAVAAIPNYFQDTGYLKTAEGFIVSRADLLELLLRKEETL